MTPSPGPFSGTHLSWPVDRSTLPFSVQVVEPRRLRPEEHTAILNAVIEDLISPPALARDRFDAVLSQPVFRRYDLVTFPEAFATADALIDVASALAGQGPSGCLHVGLRPDVSGPTHLFDYESAHSLLNRLEALLDPTIGDLQGFREWLAGQHPRHVFNLGCVLAVDSSSRLRACLHPKLVRSKFEVDLISEKHMHEADLLTLITLVPSNLRLGTITLQPVICSDALNLETDRRTAPPIAAVTEHASCFQDAPNHVDIVSVATCTPQPGGITQNRTHYREWHAAFQNAFTAAASEPQCARHHFAAFVLSNYTDISDRSQGGLSGTFLPIPPGLDQVDPRLSISCWGRPSDKSRPNNRWSSPDDDALKQWSNLGFVAGLEPSEPEKAEVARVLSFDIHRLPRETSRWRSDASLASLDIRICESRSPGRAAMQGRNSHA